VIGRVMEKVQRSFRECPRDVVVAYVGPRAVELTQMASFLEPVAIDAARQFAVYRVPE
jgi:hypothetical protein